MIIINGPSSIALTIDYKPTKDYTVSSSVVAFNLLASGSFQMVTAVQILFGVDKSILETVNSFLQFRAGFHGDTGIRDFLYHRLMTNLPGEGQYSVSAGAGTLLAQAEWHTELLYQGTGNNASRGRFDIGIPLPEDLGKLKPKPFLAIECGRNKAPFRSAEPGRRGAGLLDDVHKSKDFMWPRPADLTKLAREILFCGMPYGYALEFYDKNALANDLLERMRSHPTMKDMERLRIVVLDCRQGVKPVVHFHPGSWQHQLEREFPLLFESINQSCAATVVDKKTVDDVAEIKLQAPTSKSRKEVFLDRCPTVTRDLILAIEGHFHRRLRFVYGSETMTINQRPQGRLVRLRRDGSKPEDISLELAEYLDSRLPGSSATGFEIDESPALHQGWIEAIAFIIQKPHELKSK